MQRPPRLTPLGVLFLTAVLAAFAPQAAAAHDPAPLPMKICLRQPKTVPVNGQDTLTCPKPVSTVPAKKAFYLLVSVDDAKGLQTYALDWWVERWQPKAHRWATIRREMGTSIQPDWQYVWIFQEGLPPGSYRALVSSDFLATLVDAPTFEFLAVFKVR